MLRFGMIFIIDWYSSVKQDSVISEAEPSPIFVIWFLEMNRLREAINCRKNSAQARNMSIGIVA